MTKRLLWCDIETTGLDPVNDSILEIALVVTEDLQVIDELSIVIKQPDIPYLRNKCNDYVLNMHTENSLWKDLETAKYLFFDYGKSETSVGRNHRALSDLYADILAANEMKSCVNNAEV